ncbi:mpv17-like protein [Haematobia irritans]|uniref:mpv17-like protein n=1 Tax=Haematobia irritans TaxID=7368 RepID=UPI003F4FB993
MPLVINVLKSQWRAFTTAHPLVRGCISYAVLWPTSSLIQQTIEGKNFKTYDYMRALRFGIFGSLYIAPTLHAWVRLTSAMWPQMTLRVGLVKASIEQISYGPFASVSFFTGMSLLEGKTFEEAVQEVKNKFIPTYKVAVCVWPVLQTINFSMVPERHRLVYLSICSLIWTTFLAFMKRKEINTDQVSLQNSDEPIRVNSLLPI